MVTSLILSKSLSIFLWGTLFLNISIIVSHVCWQTGDPWHIFALKGLSLSWMLLLYQIMIKITCWHHLFQIISLFDYFTSLLALNCTRPNFFWNVLQAWMTGMDVHLQIHWIWPDKIWNILCSYCLYRPNVFRVWFVIESSCCFANKTGIVPFPLPCKKLWCSMFK